MKPTHDKHEMKRKGLWGGGGGGGRRHIVIIKGQDQNTIDIWWRGKEWERGVHHNIRKSWNEKEKNRRETHCNNKKTRPKHDEYEEDLDWQHTCYIWRLNHPTPANYYLLHHTLGNRVRERGVASTKKHNDHHHHLQEYDKQHKHYIKTMKHSVM
jgi:hypothetical protein